MTTEEIKLMREIGDKIAAMTMEFYASKRNVEYKITPNTEIRQLLEHFNRQWFILARLHELEKAAVNFQKLSTK